MPCEIEPLTVASELFHSSDSVLECSSARVRDSSVEVSRVRSVPHS